MEAESALIQHPAVLESAVVGVIDKEGLVKPKACVVLKNAGGQDSNALAVELKNFVKQMIEVYKYPRSIEWVTDLPKSATGKIQRYKLRG